MPSPPTVRVLVLCTEVLQSLAAGDLPLRGVVDRLEVASLPIVCSGLLTFARVAGLNGESAFEARIEGPDVGHIVVDSAARAKATTANPLDAVNLVFPLQDFEIDRPGRYAVRLLYDGKIGHETTLRVEET